jgi:quercetin dioxygenase-like cupin family protein
MASEERAEHAVAAPVLAFQLDEQIAELHSQQQWREEDRNAITLVKTETLCVILICMHENTAIPEHSVDGPFTITALQGHIVIELPGESRRLEAGDFAFFERALPHSVLAEEESAFLLTIVYERLP